jgi:hypothetical protein
MIGLEDDAVVVQLGLIDEHRQRHEAASQSVV